MKPVEKVIAEIHEIKQTWPRPFIEFADDNSFVHPEHYKNLLRKLTKESVRWFTEADVRAFCEANLTGYKRPKVVEFRNDLPKTPVGKILRRELRDKA